MLYLPFFCMQFLECFENVPYWWTFKRTDVSEPCTATGCQNNVSFSFSFSKKEIKTIVLVSIALLLNVLWCQYLTFSDDNVSQYYFLPFFFFFHRWIWLVYRGVLHKRYPGFVHWGNSWRSHWQRFPWHYTHFVMFTAGRGCSVAGIRKLFIPASALE